jgi:transcriptional regulator with XRE-family HTH domain
VPRYTDEAELQREIGRRVRVARVQAGLTQEEAASAAGIDWRRWQRIENGTVNPTVRTLARVASAVGLIFWTLLAPAAPASDESAAPGRKPKGSAKRGK